MALTLIRGKKLNGPDPALVKDQLEMLQKMYSVYGRAFFVKNMLYILQKNPESDSVRELPNEHWNRRLVPFRFNRIQRDLDKNMGLRNICNKPRQAGYCVHPDTWVQRPEGTWTQYKFLKKGDYVLNEQGEPVQILKVIEIDDYVHAYKGQASKVVIEGIEQLAATVAPNHPFLTTRGLVEAKDLQPGVDYVAYPKRKVNGTLKSVTLSDKREVKLTRDVGLLCGLGISDGVEFRTKQFAIRNTNKIKDKYLKTSISARVAGVLTKDKHFAFTPLGKWFSLNFGGHRETRRVPTWIYDAPEEFLVGLVEGFLVGCGEWFSSGIEVISKNERVVSHIRNISAAVGLGVPYFGINDDGERFILFYCDEVFEWTSKKLGLTKFDSGVGIQKQDAQFVYQRVKKVVPTTCKKFLDIEVDSKSHLYTLPLGITHNTTFFINVRLFTPAVMEPGAGGLLISQNSKYATAHFGILKRAHRYIGCVDPFDAEKNLLHRQLVQNLLHTSSSNRKELIFDQLDSRVLIESAEVEEAGQGFTLNHVVATEVARWPRNPEETLANLKEAIAFGGTLDIESTPNGLGGYYYEEYMRAKRGGPDAEFRSFFHPWFWHDEYRTRPAMPEKELDDEERKKQMLFNLDLEQMTWRRKKMVSLRHNFKEKYPEDDVTCFLTNGRMFFDQEICAARVAELQVYEPLAEERNGEVIIFQKPNKKRRYIIGADPAEGKQVTNESGDFSCAKVIDEETGEECAAYRSKLPPEDFAADLVELGDYYNQALIAVERNNHGHTVILELANLHYGNVYKHVEPLKRNRRSATGKEVIKVEGWPTNNRTRKMTLNKLGWFIRHFPELIYDISLIQEALVFVYDKRGIPSAAEGCHDDMVLASGIAHIVRMVVLGWIDPLTWTSKSYGTFEEEEEELEDAG